MGQVYYGPSPPRQAAGWGPRGTGSFLFSVTRTADGGCGLFFEAAEACAKALPYKGLRVICHEKPLGYAPRYNLIFRACALSI